MIGKTSVLLSLLLLCIVFIPAQSDPMQKNAEDRPPALKRERRTFGFNWFGSRDWSQFRQIWKLPSLPTITSVNFFDDDRFHENFHKRITDLENGHRRIVDYIRKLHTDKNANGCGTTQLPESLPKPVADSVDTPVASTNATEIVSEPQTSSTASTTTTLVTADDSAVKFPQEQQTVTTTTMRLKDEKTETIVTTDSSDESADKDKEAVTTTVSEELSNTADGETTVTSESDDSEETNDVFV